MKFIFNYFFILLPLFIISSCEKDKSLEPTFDDLSFQLLLLDTNGVVTSDFINGSDIVFQTAIENTLSDTIYFYFMDCVINNYRVFQNDSLIGHPQPDNWFCTYELQITQLSPHEVLNVKINWLQRPENTPLPAGKYTAKHYFSIRFMGRGDSHNIELEKEFIVN